MHYIKLFLNVSKLRVVELIFITMIPSITFIIKRYEVSHTLLKISVTAIGGIIAAMGAGAINNYIDRDIDALMKRTKNRATVKKEIPSRFILYYALILISLSLLAYVFFLNIAAALLLLTAVLIYSFFYTIILKRHNWQNIVWGGVAGGFPPVIASVALIHKVDMISLLLGLIVFFWTPVHYWPLSYYYLEDYKKAKVPMLPVVKSLRFFKIQILLYYFYMLFIVVLIPIYIKLNILSISSILIISFLYLLSLLNYISESDHNKFLKKSMKVFHYSIYYLFFLFVILTVNFLIV